MPEVPSGRMVFRSTDFLFLRGLLFLRYRRHVRCISIRRYVVSFAFDNRVFSTHITAHVHTCNTDSACLDIAAESLKLGIGNAMWEEFLIIGGLWEGESCGYEIGFILDLTNDVLFSQTLTAFRLIEFNYSKLHLVMLQECLLCSPRVVAWYERQTRKSLRFSRNVQFFTKDKMVAFAFCDIGSSFLM